MEFSAYFRLLRRWYWLVGLAAFIAGGIAFVVNSGRPPVYRAQSTVSIGGFIEARNPQATDIFVGQELARTYAQLLKTYDVLQGVVDALNLDMSPEQLGALFSVSIIEQTSLLVISVTYTDPVLAADIANGVAEQLIQKSPTNLTREQQAQIDLAKDQIAALTSQLEDARRRLTVIDSDLAEADSDTRRTQLTELRNAIITQINQAAATIAQFNDTISNLQRNTNALDIVERARIPTAPTGRGVLTTTLLGALVGAAAAFGLALLIEYLDETIRSPEDVAQVLKAPVLGAIMRFGKKTDTYPERLVTYMPSMSPVAEAYRTVRTNLLYASDVEGDGRSESMIYIITSPGPSEGKSITTANLAATMAQAGLQVLLIDCDLRRPRIHEVFGLPNDVGFTTLLQGDPRRDDYAEEDDEGMRYERSGMLPTNLNVCLQRTDLPKLWVITSGFIPSNPTELLGSTLLKRWIDVFRASSHIDVVLIDTPPCLMAADSSVLAAAARAEVVLVLDNGRTKRRAALKAKEQFEQLGIGLRGVILNCVSRRDHSYEYGYGYGYYYTATPENGSANGGMLQRILRRKN